MLPERRIYLDSIFDNFMDNTSNFDLMKCDVYESDGNYHIQADIPGFKKEEISVECENGYITITAEKNNDYEEKNENKKYIKKERLYGKTIRKFYIGEVDNDKIEANFKDGILELIIPKQEKLPTKKSIEIK